MTQPELLTGTLQDRARAIWNEADPTSCAAETFIAAVIENQKRTADTYTRSFFLAFVLAAIYWLLTSGVVTEITLLSVTVRDLVVIRWGLTLALAFVYYHGAGAFMFDATLYYVSRGYFQKFLPAVASADLESLTAPPSFLNVERFFANVRQSHAQMIARWFALGVILLLLFGPAVVVGVMIVANLRAAPSGIGLAELLAAIAASVLLIRTVALCIDVLLEEARGTG